MVPLPAGVSSGHTTTYQNHNPVPEASRALSQAAPCPCRGDGWQRGFFLRHKKCQKITARQPASSKHLARITRRKSPGLLLLIGLTFSGAAFHQPPSAKKHESDLQEGEKKKKGKIGFNSVAGLGLVSAASQPRAGRDPARGKGQQEGVGYTRPSPSISISLSPEHPFL